jgi:hypothetical protein
MMPRLFLFIRGTIKGNGTLVLIATRIREIIHSTPVLIAMNTVISRMLIKNMVELMDMHTTVLHVTDVIQQVRVEEVLIMPELVSR